MSAASRGARPVPVGLLRPGQVVVDIPGVRLRPRRGAPVTVIDCRAGWDGGPVWLLTLSDRPRRPVVLDLDEHVQVAADNAREER